MRTVLVVGREFILAWFLVLAVLRAFVWLGLFLPERARGMELTETAYMWGMLVFLYGLGVLIGTGFVLFAWMILHSAFPSIPYPF